MLLNRVEKLLMNNPVRAAIQRHLEARSLRALGGQMRGGHALEIGCGRGVGVEIILDLFGADRVDAFDLDPDMVDRARVRLAGRPQGQARLWVGDVTSIAAEEARYDAVFDFGIVHHVPAWRQALAEIHRVLKPGGRFYGEEVLTKFLENPLWRRLLRHPETDRFDHATFLAALEQTGFKVVAAQNLLGQFDLVVADRPELPRA